MGTERTKVSFHLASIPRPQDVYRILVNNMNEPFEHVWLPLSEDGSRFIHPLEELSVFSFVDINTRDIKPVSPPAIECTPFKLVQEVKDLKELVAKLHNVTEFAVDLEHNQYRSFLGLTCLMQISTRTEDFIVDTLKLRVHIGPYLREIFKDPTKKKVMHGADKDILWLQRDFGIYVCNMFDTGQASRVLNMERNSLEFLLLYFCGISANKEYQTADWRLRPLMDEMLRYAREDTHYLLYIYDVMKMMLVFSSPESLPKALLLEVYQRSYNICRQLYQKDFVTEYSYLNIYGLHEADFNAQQLAIVAGLCEWRDIVARTEDESTGYVLPNKSLIEIAKHMPVTTGDLRRLLRFKHPHVQRNLSSVVTVIQHSIQNAAAFEIISRRLTQERLEMEAVRMLQRMYEEASFRPFGAPGPHCCSRGVPNRFGNEVGRHLARINRNHQPEGSSVHARGSWDVLSGFGFTSKKSSHYGAGGSGWVQKDRRSCWFGTGTLPGNRKFDRGKRAMEETKLKPFSSFTKKLKPPHLFQETRNYSATSSKLEHIVSLQKSGSVTAEEKHDIVSDLSSSFQKLLQMTEKPEGSGGRGLSEVEQFDHTAAGEEQRNGGKKVKPANGSMKKCGRGGGKGSRDV